MTDTSPQPSPTSLPAPYADAAGALDLDGLRHLTEILRTELPVALRSSVLSLRQARGSVVVEEDTYDVVRRLTDAGEVLRRVAEAFLAAAKEADAMVEEEAVTVHGEDDGIPRASLFVPDGAGQRIAVRADYGTGTDTWDLASLVGWLVEDEIADYKAADPLQRGLRDAGAPAPMLWDDDQVREVSRNVVDRLLALGKFTPGVKAIDALRLRLSEKGCDVEAGVLRQVRQRGERVYRGVKITREPMPKSQR
jgi:hypothetical protein